MIVHVHVHARSNFKRKASLLSYDFLCTCLVSVHGKEGLADVIKIIILGFAPSITYGKLPTY